MGLKEVEVLVKMESLKPSGSLKYMIYREMISRAEEAGGLKEGMGSSRYSRSENRL
jgi:cysteine synthase